MKTEIKVSGRKVTYEIPSSLEEAIAWPGSSAEVVYGHFLKQELFHGSYGNIRSAATEILEKGHIDADGTVVYEPNTATRKFFLKGEEVIEVVTEDESDNTWKFAESGKKVPVSKEDDIKLETEDVFIKRYWSEVGASEADMDFLIQLAADLNPFNPQKRTRVASGPKKANKTNLKIATEIADNGGLERVASQLSFDLGYTIDVTGDRDEAINTLALAIGENEKREAEARKNKYMVMGG